MYSLTQSSWTNSGNSVSCPSPNTPLTWTTKNIYKVYWDIKIQWILFTNFAFCFNKPICSIKQKMIINSMPFWMIFLPTMINWSIAIMILTKYPFPQLVITSLMNSFKWSIRISWGILKCKDRQCSKKSKKEMKTNDMSKYSMFLKIKN